MFSQWEAIVKNPAKFYPDQIWNDGALRFFEQRRPNNNKMTSDMGSVPYPKTNVYHEKKVVKRALKIADCTYW